MGILASILTFNQFDPQIIIYIVILVFLLFCSAMMSGSETALFSLSPANINSIKKRFSHSDQAILKLLSTQDYLLATVLIGNNLANICVVLISNKIINMMVTFWGSLAWEFVIKTVLVTFILLLFGEIMPKVYAAYNPMRFGRMVAVPLLSLKSLFKPFSWLLIRSSSRLNESVSRKKINISIDELSDAIEITKNQTEEERQMLSGIVSFVNTEVSEVMKLRPDIIALDIDEKFSAVKRVIIRSGFSRIPVYSENVDNIKGILYIKDMIPYIGEGDDFGWQGYLRDAYFVPENKKINDLLEEFQNGKVHLAIVVDEYGATQGLISLEDILEEIVGEITDESDARESTFYEKIDENIYVFDGKTHLIDLEKVLGVEEDYFKQASGGSETIAGLMLELKRDFLRKGEKVTSQGADFIVNSLDGRRIDKVKVIINRK